jgi:predicted phosphodiesterase
MTGETAAATSGLGRRSFLSGAALLGASAAVPAAAAAPSSSGTLRFCAFADIHYCPKALPHDSREWLERILARAERTKCDMVIHMGDFTHKPSAHKGYVDFYNDFKIPCRHTLGNHDDDGNAHEKTLDAYRLERGHYHFDRNGFRFVVTDTNHCLVDGRWLHYSKGNYYAVGRRSKTNVSRVSPAQLEWMKSVIEDSPYPCIVTSHASYERPVSGGGSPDGAAVRRIFNEVNARHPGRVRLVVNGHHHRDNVRILDNIVYLDLNSANYDWIPTAHSLYPAEVSARWRLANHTIMWDDPISAVITISQDGRLRVEGQRSRFHLGIAPNGGREPVADGCGRFTTPAIQSFDLQMRYTP